MAGDKLPLTNSRGSGSRKLSIPGELRQIADAAPAAGQTEAQNRKLAAEVARRRREQTLAASPVGNASAALIPDHFHYW